MYYKVIQEIKYCNTRAGNRITHHYLPGTVLDTENREEIPEELEKIFLKIGKLAKIDGLAKAEIITPNPPEPPEPENRPPAWTHEINKEKLHAEIEVPEIQVEVPEPVKEPVINEEKKSIEKSKKKAAKKKEKKGKGKR